METGKGWITSKMHLNQNIPQVAKAKACANSPHVEIQTCKCNTAERENEPAKSNKCLQITEQYCRIILQMVLKREDRMGERCSRWCASDVQSHTGIRLSG